jgi:hypothetical protein
MRKSALFGVPTVMYLTYGFSDPSKQPIASCQYAI